LRPASLVLHLLFSIAPFLVFWRNLRVADRMRPLAVLCMAWGAADFIWFLVELTGIPIPGVPNLFARWGLTLLGARGFAIAGLLTALLALMFREQRQVTEERAMLAGEMQAAGDIQRMLAPSTLETAPGLRIEVAFRPMREVGGDFYQCRVLPDGRQRLLIGDVSGKGTGAAMAAALILGGAAARDSDSPAELLAHLNRVLRESQVGGFATCLCADVAPDGCVQFANAGHLSPYCRNQEIAVQPGLPLGLTLETHYEQMKFQLAPGSTLTFLSDGVVEARDSAGSLFGFERTQELSSQPAATIADAAQRFGQEDDITVLTLSRLPAVVEAKTEPGSAVFAQARPRKSPQIDSKFLKKNTFSILKNISVIRSYFLNHLCYSFHQMICEAGVGTPPHHPQSISEGDIPWLSPVGTLTAKSFPCRTVSTRSSATCNRNRRAR
jgi:hypothetical protein